MLAREILYGITGFFLGTLLGFVFVAFAMDWFLPYPFSIIFMVGAGVIVAILGVVLARKINVKESTAVHGHFFLAVRIFGWQMIVGIVVWAIWGSILLVLNSTLLTSVSDNIIFSVVFFVAMTAVGTWLGVRYLLENKYLLPSHNARSIARWVIGVNVGVTVLFLALGALFIFLKSTSDNITLSEIFNDIYASSTPESSSPNSWLISTVQFALEWGILYALVLHFVRKAQRSLPRE